MLCKRPYMMGMLECPCGRCLTCLVNRRRVWAHRIVLESYKHADSSFVTLTYDDDHVPERLEKGDYQQWLRRLRKELFPEKIRYFVSGEYGSVSARPHYHAVIFGLDRFRAGGVDGRSGIVRRTWPFGFTYVGGVTLESASYVAGYLTKKVDNGNRGREGFSKMSLRPGLGSGAMEDVARAIRCVGIERVLRDGDVPNSLSHGRKSLPLGRYLRRQLRGYLGFASKDTPAEAARMCALRFAAEKSEARAELKARGFATWDAEKLIVDMRAQKLLNAERRFALYDSKRSL